MSPRRRRGPAGPVLLIVVALLLAGCAGTGDPAAAPPPSPVAGTNGAPVPRIDWRACGGAYQCATIPVPVDYRNPRGPTIDLAAIRLPALDPATRIGTLAVNFGGPGTPGVPDLRRLADRFAGVRTRMDVLAVDPRGVGSSAPVDCGPGDLAAPPGSPRDGPAFWTAAAAAGRACAAGTGELLRHLSTANGARDLDLVRQALGEPALSVYGYSYGTYLGATYANLFPGHVRALVVDGALDLVANATGAAGTRGQPVDTRAGVPVAREEAVDGFLAACAAAGPARCAFADGDPRARYADVAAAASRGGTSAELAATVADALETAGRLPGLARELAARAAGAPPAGGVVPPSTDVAVPAHSGAFLAVQCTDSVVPTPAQVTALLPGEQAAHPVFGAPAVLDQAACVDWPAVDPDRYLGPWNAPLPAPALVINSRYDPQTPLANARATAAQLSSARLLVVDGFGHTTLDAPSRCAQDLATAYLLDPGSAPEDGSVCPADARPFG